MEMKTFEYRLKSNPNGKPVMIPQAFANDAVKIVDDTIQANDSHDLSERIHKYCKSNNYPIFSESLRLRSYLVKGQWCGVPEFLKTEDSLYLKFCLYNMYDLVEKGKLIEHNEEEHNGLLNMMIPIMNTLRSLENVDDVKKTSGDYFGEGKE